MGQKLKALTQESKKGQLYWRLPDGSCELKLVTRRQLPVGASRRLGGEYMRLWPLPVAQPFDADT